MNKMTEQELKNIFGRNVKIRRERRSWSQETLAEKADVSKNTISDIEAGQKFVRIKTMVRLAEIFETDSYELLKPDYIMPDRFEDVLAKFNEELKDAMDEIGDYYLKSMKR